MSTLGRSTVVSSLALVSLTLAALRSASGQAVSARPVSVALTVVVPPRSQSALTTETTATLVGRTASALDLQTVVGLAHRPASRIEVRLGVGWVSDTARVLVQTETGKFKPLQQNETEVAAAATPSLADTRSLLRFRVESDRPLSTGSLEIPVEYRITVGHGDQFSVWSFASRIRLDAR
jgi:hypothetical protein